MPDTSYDVIVIGGGPAGENAADVANRGDLRVALVETELLGGECSYWGCMPSKALLRPGQALREIQATPGARGAVTGEVDVEDALRRRTSLAAHWDDSGQVDWLEGAGVDLIRGHGRLAGNRLVEVETDDGTVTYEASTAVIIATGTRAAMPPIEGIHDTRVWDNRHITEAKEVPRRLAVVGGGVIGVEMAQAWHDLGAEEVTIIEMSPHLLPPEEAIAGEHLAERLTAQGITVHVDSLATAVHREADDGPVTVTFGDGATVEADEVLIATGRRAATDDLGLDTVGLEPGGHLDVDDRMLVAGVDGDWLYAVGDVNGRALLTHVGKYQARIAGARIAGLADTVAGADRTAVPRVVFTDPQVAAVGLIADDARSAGVNVRTIDLDTGHVAGAATLGKGFGGPARWVVDADREVLVGATFVGPHTGEMLHAATIAIVGEVPLSTLWHAVPAFPTVSEIWLRFLEAYRDEVGVAWA